MKNKHVVGIDCGQEGCWVSGKGDELTFIDYEKDKDFGMIDSLRLENDVKQSIEKYGKIDLVIIERQFNPSAKPQKGGFTNGSNFGLIVGVVQKVQPQQIKVVSAQTWQRMFGVYRKSKAEIAKKAVNRGFPKSELYTKRGRLKDGRTDGYLIRLGGLIIQEQLNRREGLI